MDSDGLRDPEKCAVVDEVFGVKVEVAAFDDFLTFIAEELEFATY